MYVVVPAGVLCQSILLPVLLAIASTGHELFELFGRGALRPVSTTQAF